MRVVTAARGISVIEDELDQRRETEAQALVVGFGKLAAQGLVKQNVASKSEPSWRPLHHAHTIAQVQFAGLAFERAQQRCKRRRRFEVLLT